jgi:hypothetical protein
MRERSPYNWSYPSPWAELKPGQLNLLQRFEGESVFALGVASMHYSGYVRDAALRRLSDTQDGSELPFLLLRLNDWVEEVRQTALALVRLRVTSGICAILCHEHSARESAPPCPPWATGRHSK